MSQKSSALELQKLSHLEADDRLTNFAERTLSAFCVGIVSIDFMDKFFSNFESTQIRSKRRGGTVL